MDFNRLILAAASPLIAGIRSILRPQTPNKRPYQVREVSFPGNCDSVTLAGELTMPEGTGPFPGVVLITGSGAHDRDQSLMGHKPFMLLADHLTRAGFAVLRYDDRGVAKSTGDHSSADLQDFAGDAAAAFLWLKNVDDVDETRIGYLGHSEGGVVAPLAAQTTNPAFMVFLATPARPLLPDVVITQAEALLRSKNTSETEISQQAAQIGALTKILSSSNDLAVVRQQLGDWYESDGASKNQIKEALDIWGNHWGMFHAKYDPKPAFVTFKGPVLALYGGSDLQVSASIEEPLMESYLSHADSRTYTVPGINHFLQKSNTKDADDFIFIRTTIEPAVLSLISEWTRRVVGLEKPR